MIDFTNCKELLSTYGGSEKKKKILYNNKNYLVKFPDPVREGGNSLSYMNNQYSEYIGCHILESLGIKTQNTILGKYNDNGKQKIVVACEDFTSASDELIEFSKLANSVTKIDNKFTCRIEDVYSVINNTDFIKNKTVILEKFWDLFVADALIGNPDRHLDNWGLLYNIKNETYSFSPVYDCGSCLHALISEEKKNQLLKNKSEMKNVAYNIKSAYSINGKRIFYSEFLKNPPLDLKKAILRIAPKINMDLINKIIDETATISEVDKLFFKESIKIRKELIIDAAYKKIANDYKNNI